MSYLPHAVKSASGNLPGTVRSAQLVDKGAGAPVGTRYTIYVDVELMGMPGNRRPLRAVRYAGVLSLSVEGESRTGTGPFYDGLISWVINQNPSEPIQALVQKSLIGRTVTAQIVGGRWIVT